MRVLEKGCTAVALAVCAACASHAPAGSGSNPDPVRVTTSLADVDGCSLVGKIIVSAEDPDAEKEARDQTADLGGNVMLRKNELVWNGNAYHCPPAKTH